MVAMLANVGEDRRRSTELPTVPPSASPLDFGNEEGTEKHPALYHVGKDPDIVQYASISTNRPGIARAIAGPKEHQHPTRAASTPRPFISNFLSDTIAALTSPSWQVGPSSLEHLPPLFTSNPDRAYDMLLRRLPLHPTPKHHYHQSGPHSDPADSHHQ
uniref:Uncharacterized protein n=1 Tax=Branchiostoma floridae TaxID=7739 RepID=C3YSW3_BRAFL|eukprot:XP_002600615.1 hypothetical protein BRAFLDRAFT_95129 [Branchiostoma floridae]